MFFCFRIIIIPKGMRLTNSVTFPLCLLPPHSPLLGTSVLIPIQHQRQRKFNQRHRVYAHTHDTKTVIEHLSHPASIQEHTFTLGQSPSTTEAACVPGVVGGKTIK